jgi:hypothetical protein
VKGYLLLAIIITSDKWVLSVLSVTKDPDRNLMLQEEVHTLLQKGAVELVNPPLISQNGYDLSEEIGIYFTTGNRPNRNG